MDAKAQKETPLAGRRPGDAIAGVARRPGLGTPLVSESDDKSKPEAETVREIFSYMVKNAVDFMERSVYEFNKRPKHSIISFYMGLEVFLKAALLYHDWKLVFRSKDKAFIDNLESGSFSSVSLSEIKCRLKDDCKIIIPEEEYECFRSLGFHRNLMVHFFHRGMYDDAAMSEVVTLLCRSWFYLHRFLLSIECFREYCYDIDYVDKKIKRYSLFKRNLSFRFDEVSTELDREKALERKVSRCPVCRFKSVVDRGIGRGPSGDVDPSSGDAIGLPVCLVCSYVDRSCAHIKCVKCGGYGLIASDEGWKCRYCRARYTASDVGARTIGWVGHDDGGELRAYCRSCVCDYSHDSVVRVGRGMWLCVNCGRVFPEVGICDYCHRYATGDLSDSAWLGCGLCSPLPDWMKDN